MRFETYEEMVDQRIKGDSKEVFGNFQTPHSEYIINKFLESCEKNVIIFTNMFSDDFLERLERVAHHLGTVAAVRIITINGIENKQLTKLATVTNDVLGKRVFCYIPSKNVSLENIENFVVVDSKCYRLEEASENNQFLKEVKSEVCCNGKEKALKLIEFFDKVWKQLEE